MMISDDFLRAFLSLLVIIDPIGNLMVFHILTREFSQRQQVKMIVVSITVSALLLVVFAYGGGEVLSLLGITSASFRVAAGLLLIPMAYNLVVRGELSEATHQPGLDPFQLALVPMAMPLMTGPGALATVVTYSDTLGRTTTLAAAGLVLLICATGFVLSAPLFRWLGGSFIRLLTRVVGLVVFAIATEFVLGGLAVALRSII